LRHQENPECADFALIRDVTLFDVWRDTKQESGERSLAIRLVLQDTATTLEDARVDALMARLCDILARRYGARLRT
jgi:phenylalanyl-tRNA synthetase beta chain